MATTTQAEPIPELADGDRLDAAEFERRFHAAPHIKKAELIEGVVYVASPVSITYGRPHTLLTGWILFYEVATPHISSSIDTTIRLDGRNQPRPDVYLAIIPGLGGRISISDDQYVEGAPELVVEVAVTTKALDLGPKLEAYRRNGAREYLVWRVLDRAIDWFSLSDGAYERIEPGPDGILRSGAFPGLWLDPEALFRDDLPALRAAVASGLASDEHARFVADLRERAGGA